MTTMSSLAEKPRKHPFWESEGNSPEVQQACAADPDEQASPSKDALRPKEEKQMGTIQSSPVGTKVGTPGAKTSWTIMLYIVADGALANFAVESLKQLNESARIAGDDQPKLVVGAQFAFPTGTTKPSSQSEKATGTNSKPHFLFQRGNGGDSHANNKVRTVLLKLADESSATDRSQEEMLQHFLTSVYEDRECEANRYALILWGHGPELLLQPGVSNPTGSSRIYITPEELREALYKSNSKIPKGASLDIVGFDACFMSMFEMACELKGLATYMVASQQEVPDASFPYGKLVELFRTYGDDTKLLLKKGVDAYLTTYQDYIFGGGTGIDPVTLSVLQLDKCDDLKQAVDQLVLALLAAPDNQEFRSLLLVARQTSRDYASGLYVDLYEFCSNLSKQLNKPDTDTTENWKTKIEKACQSVRAALTLAADGTSNELILKNGSDDPRFAAKGPRPRRSPRTKVRL